MKESKQIQFRDRLSDLPESLIFHIFWLLPMRDVVKTTILSKHWINLWTTTSCLNFNFKHLEDTDDMDNDEVRNFINRALMLWEGTNIQKFKIELNYTEDESFFRDFDLWLHFALRKEVQELYVVNTCSTSYFVPQYLLSSSSLRVLSVIGCCLEIKGNVLWSQLKSLTLNIARDDDDDDDVINKVLCGSPQLEVFILDFGDCYYEHLSIRSSSLKRLICRSIDCGELTICTPNLETLKISGVPHCKYSIMDVSSLTHLTLVFYNPHFSGETLREIFPTIQHVENVTLSHDWWGIIKVLGDLIKKSLIPFPPSSNAKCLKLKYDCVEYKPIVGILEIFPKLEVLVLKVYKSYRSREYQLELLEIDANVPKSFLLHLRRIEIMWEDDSMWNEDDYSMFTFIEIMLKYAIKLRKMVIRVAPAPESKYLNLALKKLLRMPRSSPNAELIFCE